MQTGVRERNMFHFFQDKRELDAFVLLTHAVCTSCVLLGLH